MKTKPKIKIISEDNDDGAYYNFVTNNIILYNGYSRATIFHEYRHYLHNKLFGTNILRFIRSLIEISIFSWFIINGVVLLFELENNLRWLPFMIYLPYYLIELDANIFALIRCWKKGIFKGNNLKCIGASLFSYTILLLMLAISITYDKI